MTTPLEARETIYESFRSGWLEETAYYFDNEMAKVGNEPWVRLAIRHNQGDQETLGAQGNRKFKRGGSVIVQIFIPLDSAISKIDELSLKVRNIFEGKTLSNIRFRGVVIREIGPDTKWYQVNVEAPFYYNEVK